MRFILVTLSYLASLMAVQATSFVTVVKTVVHDVPISSVDISAPASEHGSISDQANMSRRDEDNSLGDPSVTVVCITSPVTTCVDITITPSSTDAPKSTDTKSETTDDDDDEGWEEVTETTSPTTPTPATTTAEPASQIGPSTITLTRETPLNSPSPSGPPIRNTGTPITHAPSHTTYYDIPEWWPPSVGPNVDPKIETPWLPEIINPGATSTNPADKHFPTWCEGNVYNYPPCKPGSTERCCDEDQATVFM